MFDIDYLTDSMNYIPVSLENQTNPHAGTSEVTNSAGTLQTPNANASEEEDEAEELIVVPTVVKHTAAKVGPRKSSTNSKAEEFLTKLPTIKQEKRHPTGISEDTHEILAFRRELDELAQKHSREVPKNKATSTTSVNSGSGPVNTQHADQDDSICQSYNLYASLNRDFLCGSYDDEGMVHDFNNLPTEVVVSPIPTLRIHNIHPQSQILGDPKSSVQTRSRKLSNIIQGHAPLKSWCDKFEDLMQGRFQMSSIDLLTKFDLASVKTVITPMETKMALTKDEEADDVDVHLYRSMIDAPQCTPTATTGRCLVVTVALQREVTTAAAVGCGVKLINGICLNYTYGDGKPVTCCGCEGPLNGGFCSFYALRARNSFAYDPNPNSFNDSQNLSDYPPQPQYQTYSYELCGNDAHYGYDCPPQVSFHAFKEKQHQPEDIQELLHKLLKDLQMISEELADYINTPNWNCPAFYEDDDEEYTIVIIPILPTEEPDNSLSMGDEHLSTILETESDELIKSSVENLVPIPSESEDFSDIESECDVPVCDNFTTFSNPLFDADDDFSSSDDESFSDEDVPKKIYSNPLFDEEIISTKIDLHHFNVESNLIESFLNRNTSIVSSPKFDSLLEEFSGELAHIDLISPEIDEADFDPEEEIHLVEKLLYDNSSPRPPEEFNSENSDAVIESFSPSPIPVEDSDSLMEEIDIFLAPDDSIPPVISLDRYYVPSSPRPPEKPPDDDDVYFDIEPDTGVFTKVVDDISDNSTRELYVHVPNVLPTLPNLSPMFDTLLPFSSENDDKVFNPGILASNEEKSPHLLSHRGFKAFQVNSDFSKSPMMIYKEDILILDVLFLHFYPP
ncbi:hypothetical protein Tco_0969977 [Tanacetum coccineum]